MSVPTVEELREAFCCLDELEFFRTGRLPLVAARQWRPAWEKEAWRRFNEGLANVHEVAWPRFYLSREGSETRRLFLSLTLGREDERVAKRPALSCFFRRGVLPEWTVVHRFGRYVLRSHPDLDGEDWVYFGDDTLFLMERSRALLNRMDAPCRCLDLCCGGGGVGLALPEFEGSLLGVDLNSTAVSLAENTALAQNLANYRYQCCDALQGLEGEFDLIFGNPPTLSPVLTGRDVFHATGSDDVLPLLLEKILNALTTTGRAVLTFFSEVRGGRDTQWERLEKLLVGRRGFHCYSRREYPLGTGRFLRHSALELQPLGQDEHVFEPLEYRGIQLPAVKQRQL
ncbi:MAG: methyltransferase [Candidatus Eremiobacteraeota bacterium]|nr:methyltransferase [Candidatus Eremiobacteraeota bacterium]